MPVFPGFLEIIRVVHKIKEYKIMAGETIQIYNNGNMMHDFDFKPSTSIDEELGKFVTWFKEYYRYE